MSIEIEVGSITAFDNSNGQGVLATVEFKDYEISHEDIVVQVILPLDKDASLAVIEDRAVEKAKQQLRDLVSTF
ncbi:hypothetical protein [Duffyella gerundensis]|uniref:hypothetical protein n=1 Tax=Duffyella gerundensis TaxID=1619313 RepID=UPI001653F16D|nr:hypothetical protein [Duffyella gerundensis]